MISLDDAGLTRIFIAADAVPVGMRGRWLRQLAAQLEPPQASNGSAAQRTRGRDYRISNGAARTRLHRSRQAAGRAVLRVEADLNSASMANHLPAKHLREREARRAGHLGGTPSRLAHP